MLMLITTPKLAKRAEDLYNDEDVPLHYHLAGEGTASSEMMDILGLESLEKGILISFLPKCFAFCCYGAIFAYSLLFNKK